MARRSKVQIRETYSKMLGEDLIAKLSDDQIVILSKYYNSLDAEETSDLDSQLIQGRNDTDLHEMARDMVGEEDEDEDIDKKIRDYQLETRKKELEEKVFARIREKNDEDEDIPEGLDDLLGSIQDEPAEETPEPKVTTIKASAIVPAKFFGEDKYAKYRDELVADGTIEGEQLTSEERIEGFKTRNDSDKFSRFVENFLNRKKQSDNEETKTLDGSGGALVVPTQQKINVDPVEEENESNFDDILKGIDSILDIIKKDQKFEEKKAVKEEKKSEREKRSIRENKLEKKDSTLMKAAKKIIAPVKSIFDKILEFFVTIFLGRALFKLLEWFGDKENGKKIQSIIKFLGDFWPALLGGYLIFGTGLGGLISSITTGLVLFTPKILALLANPIVAGTVLAGAGIFAAGKMLQKDKVVENETQRQETTRQALEQAPSTKDKSPGEREALVQSTRLKDAGGGGSLNAMPNEFVDPLGLRQDPSGMMGGMQAFSGGGMVEKKDKKSFNIFNPMSWFSGDAQKATEGKLDNVSNDTLGGRLYNRRKQQEEMMKKLRGYEEGGRVRGESGIDKVPAMLTNGEFVMSTGAVQKYGLDTMMAMNAAGGGTNKPKIMEGMMYANGGAPVGEIDFDPVSYRQGMISSRHIENPGNTGETYVLGYTRSPEGDVMVKQMNRVVDKAGILSLIGASDSLTGVSPESDKWNLVLNSANTQKELSTSSGTGRSKRKVAPKSIKTDPKAKIAYAYNQSYQTIKDNWQKKGVSAEKAKQYAAAGAAQGAKLAEDGAYLPSSDKGYKELENVNVKRGTPEKPNSIVEMLKNTIMSMAGVSPDSDNKKENTREYSQANLQGAKLGDGYGSEGQKIAGDLGTFMKQKKSALPVTGSIHRHPEHLPWAKSGHSANSYHYEGRALDIGGWAPSHPSSGGNDEQAPVIKSLIEYNKKNKVEPVELIHGSPSYKNYGSYREHPDSHANHVHVAYNKGGAVIKKPAKLTVPEITPLQKQKPKISVVNGGTKSNVPKRQLAPTQVPSFNASSASREKANLLGIIDY